MFKDVRRLIIGAVFFGTLVLLLSIENEYLTPDEYRFVEAILSGNVHHGYRILSTWGQYLTWWSLDRVGVPMGAMRAGQIFNSFFSAMGAAALVDLAFYWGYSTLAGVLFSLATILCNAFLRYGASLFPGSAATGIGLVGLNLLIRAMDRPKEKRLWRWSGLAWAFAGLVHAVSLVQLIAPLFVIARKDSESRRQLWIAAKQAFLPVFAGIISLGLIYYYSFSTPTAQDSGEKHLTLLWSQFADRDRPIWSEAWLTFNTFLALYVPGVHVSEGQTSDWLLKGALELLFNLPRALAAILILFMLILTWRDKHSKREWALAFLAGCSVHFILQTLSIPMSRQYTVMTLISFGPFFLVLGRSLPRRVNQIGAALAAVFLFHAVFGAEGIQFLHTWSHHRHIAEEKNLGVRPQRAPDFLPYLKRTL